MHECGGLKCHGSSLVAKPCKKLVYRPLKTEGSLSPELEVSSRSQDFQPRLCFRRGPARIPSSFPESLGSDVLSPSEATLPTAAQLHLIHICFCPFFLSSPQ